MADERADALDELARELDRALRVRHRCSDRGADRGDRGTASVLRLGVSGPITAVEMDELADPRAGVRDRDRDAAPRELVAELDEQRHRRAIDIAGLREVDVERAAGDAGRPRMERRPDRGRIARAQLAGQREARWRATDRPRGCYHRSHGGSESSTSPAAW